MLNIQSFAQLKKLCAESFVLVEIKKFKWLEACNRIITN